MIKQYFTDGLIQIAIILSLLRTDLNNYLNSNFINYPEVQDIILGQSLAYTPANFHNHFNVLNSLSGSVHPKSIDNEYFSAIFQDLRSLSRFRHFEGLHTEIDAFLVSETSFGHTAAAGATTSGASQNGGNDNENSNINVASTSSSLTAEASISGQSSSTEALSAFVADNNSDGAVGFPPTVDSGSDPTNEDLDLIEVLWRQDIDLGVGKEVFDVNLRRELERERELELQKKREKQKELELLRIKVQEEQRQQQQQWLTDNFMQDGETGEWVPLAANSNNVPPPTQLQTGISGVNQIVEDDFSLEEALEYLNAGTSVLSDADFVLPENNMCTQIPLSPEQQSQTDSTHVVDSFIAEAELYVNQPLQQPQQGLHRQESFEQRWQDLVHLLNFTNANASQDDLNAAINATSNMSTEIVDHCVNNNVLLQNATLPTPVGDVGLPNPVANATSLHDLPLMNTTGFGPSAQDFNSSVPNAGGVSQLEWEASDLLFTNVSSTINQTESLDDVDDILPDFLPEDELDIAINEGLQTMQMLDDASSDSAISMGSASPLQDMNDTLAMSPFDGLEGATGGSSYGSPSYSKASKYDPEEYSYSSYSYSQSDSSQTNYSTSSNDTDFNRQSGTNHIQHNHTYPLQPGASPKEVKAYTKTDKPKHKGPHSRDQKRASELKLPFSVNQIIQSPVEEFNEMMTKYKLTEPQIQLIRDIRRRGKNKVAAQNCRKRKLDTVYTLEEELEHLRATKDKLQRERYYIDKQTRDMKEKFTNMYQEIFSSLRDEHGRPYDPNEFSLQQSSDGNVFLVPRNISADEQSMKVNKRRKNDKK